MPQKIFSRNTLPTPFSGKSASDNRQEILETLEVNLMPSKPIQEKDPDWLVIRGIANYIFENFLTSEYTDIDHYIDAIKSKTTEILLDYCHTHNLIKGKDI